MGLYRNIPENIETFLHPVVTIGSFDGVHLGHHRIFSSLLNIARQKGGEPVVLTFSTHPRKVLTPETPPRILTTTEEKLSQIKKCGIENVIILDFSHEIAEMSASKFFSDIVLTKLRAIDVVLGYDHAFGKDREGNMKFLGELSRERGFGLTRVEPKNYLSRPISSTWIRTELEDGNIKMANELLGRRYTLSGIVVQGVSRGKKIGFPTANIVPDDPDKVVPRDGVYAVTLSVNKGVTRKGMLNIGTNPTFSDTERSIEVNIFDFNEDIYGSNLELEFWERIRNEVYFKSAEELVEQLKDDRIKSLDILNG